MPDSGGEKNIGCAHKKDRINSPFSVTASFTYPFVLARSLHKNDCELIYFIVRSHFNLPLRFNDSFSFRKFQRFAFIQINSVADARP